MGMIFYFFEFTVNCPVEADEVSTEIRGTFDTARTNIKDCSGSLRIIHSHPDDFGNYDEIMLSKKPAFSNLFQGYPKLRRNVVLKIESHGTCCWRLYSRTNFKGTMKQDVHGEIEHMFKPKSAKKIKCSSIDDYYVDNY